MIVFGYATGLMAANFAVSYFEVMYDSWRYTIAVLNKDQQSNRRDMSDFFDSYRAKFRILPFDTQTGQPALLYIVPLTLGPVLFR